MAIVGSADGDLEYRSILLAGKPTIFASAAVSSVAGAGVPEGESLGEPATPDRSGPLPV
jgi:hypothetical protein